MSTETCVVTGPGLCSTSSEAPTCGITRATSCGPLGLLEALCLSAMSVLVQECLQFLQILCCSQVSCCGP